MIQTLQALQQKQEVVSLYSNPDDTRKFAVGYLLTVTEEELLVAQYCAGRRIRRIFCL